MKTTYNERQPQIIKIGISQQQFSLIFFYLSSGDQTKNNDASNEEELQWKTISKYLKLKYLSSH